MNIFDVIKRSNAGLALTPMERAVLKAMQGALLTSLSLLLPYGNDILAGRINVNSVDWLHIVEMIGYGMLLAGMVKIVGTANPSDKATSDVLQQQEQDLNRSEVGVITNASTVLVPPEGGSVFAPPSGPGFATERTVHYNAFGTPVIQSPLITPGTATTPLTVQTVADAFKQPTD